MDPLKLAETLRNAAWFHMEAGRIDASILMSARAAELEREFFNRPKPDTAVIL